MQNSIKEGLYEERLTAIVEEKLAVIVEERLTHIERLLETLIAQRPVKDWYTVKEVAERVERTPYQVRDWLNTGRIVGEKRAAGRGPNKEWKISLEELTRYLNHGLLPK